MELKKIKLNKLSNNALAERQMKGLKGGSPDGSCFCACRYAKHGGSSTNDNALANSDKGLDSPGGGYGVHVPSPIVIDL